MADLWMRFPGGKAKAFTMSYDDGVEQDIRLIEIMNRFGLKGTFNLNAGLFAPEGTVYPKGQISRRLSAKRALELYRDSGNEVAIHGLTHPFLDKIPVPRMVYEIVEDRTSVGRNVRLCCARYGLSLWHAEPGCDKGVEGGGNYLCQNDGQYGQL